MSTSKGITFQPWKRNPDKKRAAGPVIDRTGHDFKAGHRTGLLIGGAFGLLLGAAATATALQFLR